MQEKAKNEFFLFSCVPHRSYLGGYRIRLNDYGSAYLGLSLIPQRLLGRRTRTSWRDQRSRDQLARPSPGAIVVGYRLLDHRPIVMQASSP